MVKSNERQLYMYSQANCEKIVRKAIFWALGIELFIAMKRKMVKEKLNKQQQEWKNISKK